MVLYRVTHRTEYHYESEVSASYSQMHLLPRHTAHQSCRTSGIRVEPVATHTRERIDHFGNRAMYAEVLVPHLVLAVTATSMVDVADPTRRLAPPVAWETASGAFSSNVWRDPELLEAAPFALDSPMVAASEVLLDYARPSFSPGRDLLDAVAHLCGRIHTDFEFKPGATTVQTTLPEVMSRRAGVCQDFAHVAIGCLRSLGLPARYVSGYVETDPPPGRPKLQGADVSHAWISAFAPGDGWVDIDPTNDQFVGSRYVTTAWGRDYGDVPPVKGVIYTRGATRELRVRVDVARVDDRPREQRPLLHQQ
jgi:transglutaminase-like putative cysteine protease